MPHAPRSSHSPPVRVAWLEAILLMATFIRLSGQEAPTLPDPGTRVRVTARGLPGARVSGTLQSWLPDTLIVTQDSTGDTLHVAMGTVRRLDVSRGFHSDSDIGATAGLAFGAGIDVLLTIAVSRDPEYSEVAPRIGLFGLAIFGGGFALIGSILGSTTESERWRQVRLSLAPPRVGIVPLGQGRLGLGFRVGL